MGTPYSIILILAVLTTLMPQPGADGTLSKGCERFCLLLVTSHPKTQWLEATAIYSFLQFWGLVAWFHCWFLLALLMGIR